MAERRRHRRRNTNEDPEDGLGTPLSGRARYWDQVRGIAQERGVSIPRARELWRSIHRPAARVIRSIASSISIRPSETTLLCPYCRDELSDDSTACAFCETRYHTECLSELGRCAIIGCRGQSQSMRARPTVTVHAVGPADERLSETMGPTIIAGALLALMSPVIIFIIAYILHWLS